MKPNSVPPRLVVESELPEFASWSPAPPPDPSLLRRLGDARWERGLAGFAIAALAVGFGWIVHISKSGLSSVYAFMVVGASIWEAASFRRAPARMAEWIDLPATVPQFPVEITFIAAKARYGFDVGFVSFVDGWMHFQGSQTTFSLHVTDTLNGYDASHLGSATFRHSMGSKPKGVSWVMQGVEYRLNIRPLDRVKGLGTGLATEFRKAIDAWFPAKDVKQGKLLFPPIQCMVGETKRAFRGLWLTGLPAAISIPMALFCAQPWITVGSSLVRAQTGMAITLVAAISALYSVQYYRELSVLKRREAGRLFVPMSKTLQ